MRAESLWIFGYGSLVWRPDIPFDVDAPAVVHGWKRRFWQGSTDHRGLPGAPGRVVTLLPSPGERVVGRAFRIPDAERDAVLARLDHRERGGYERDEVDLFRLEGDFLARGLVYRATPDNPNYLGPASVEALAAQVLRSSGPSGPNDAYVLELHDALAAWDAVDDHLRELAAKVRAGRA